MRTALLLVLTLALSLPASAQSVQGPLTVTAAPGALDTRLTVQGPEAFVIMESTDLDPTKEVPLVAFKVDLAAGHRRKIGVLAFQYSGDFQSGYGLWNIHSTKTKDWSGTDTFQISGCAGKRLSIFPHQIGPNFCAPEGWMFVYGNQRVTENLQVDGELQGKTIAALEARIAALEALLLGTTPQPRPGQSARTQAPRGPVLVSVCAEGYISLTADGQNCIPR